MASNRSNINICIVSDGTDSLIQSREVAARLSPEGNITKIYKDETLTDNFPDLAIGVGFNVTEALVSIKQNSKGKTKIAVILDPLKSYEDFDFIILPAYEPYKIKGDNVIRTTGLINFVNDNYLAAQKFDLENHPKFKFLRDMNLKPPFVTVVIGGRHTGGNIDEFDVENIAGKINEIVSINGGTALITTSKRSETLVPEVLRRELKVPYFLYDYKTRNTENPYGVFLALANEILVTGESVRMLSETCSTGKPVRIYCPRAYGFQYKPLIDELISQGNAFDFSGHTPNVINKLDEAGRVAAIIRNKL
jgi:mitochondrial fission protein ELM1